MTKFQFSEMARVIAHGKDAACSRCDDATGRHSLHLPPKPNSFGNKARAAILCNEGMPGNMMEIQGYKPQPDHGFSFNMNDAEWPRSINYHTFEECVLAYRKLALTLCDREGKEKPLWKGEAPYEGHHSQLNKVALWTCWGCIERLHRWGELKFWPQSLEKIKIFRSPKELGNHQQTCLERQDMKEKECSACNRRGCKACVFTVEEVLPNVRVQRPAPMEELAPVLYMKLVSIMDRTQKEEDRNVLSRMNLYGELHNMINRKLTPLKDRVDELERKNRSMRARLNQLGAWKKGYNPSRIDSQEDDEGDADTEGWESPDTEEDPNIHKGAKRMKRN